LSAQVFCRFVPLNACFAPLVADDERWGEQLDWAHVAQLVEHVLGKDEVSGSIPLVGST
jgi:hypothetical protein